MTAEAGPHSHPRHELDPVLLHGVRFSVAAVLSGADTLSFAYVRDLVEVPDSVLSKQLTVLEGAGYVLITKRAQGRRTKTWVALTGDGRRAYRRHRQALVAVAQTAEIPETTEHAQTLTTPDRAIAAEQV